MRRLQIATAILSVVVPAFGADQPYKPGKLQWQIEFRYGGTYAATPIKQFSNIPASYRTVPWHPDDDPTHSKTTTIPDATLSPPGNILLAGYKPTTGLTFYNRVTLRMVFDIQSSGTTKIGPGNDGIIREIDIFSNTYNRLEGASLVYYALPRPHWPVWPNPTPEVELRIWKQFGFLAGGWEKNFLYNIQRGYDRYSAMQVLDNTPFLNVKMYHPYIGLKLAWAPEADSGLWVGAIFSAGPMWMKPQFVPQAQGTQYTGSTRGLMFNLDITVGGILKQTKPSK